MKHHRGTKAQRSILCLCAFVFLWFSSAWGQRIDQLLQGAQEDLRSGNLVDATSKLQRVLEVDPKNKQARQALVDVLMRQVRWDEAAAEIEILRRQFPADAGVAFLAAAVAFRKGEFERAGQLASEALSGGDQPAEVYQLLALSRFMLGDAEGFKQTLLTAIERHPRAAEAHYHLGRYYYENKHYTDALSSLNRATDIDADHYKAHYFAALVLQASGEAKESIERYRQTIKIVERKKVAYGWPYADLGELLVVQGEYENGIGWLYRGVRNDPALPYTHFKYAANLLKKEASAEVEKHLQAAVRLDPAYTEAYYLLGRYYSKIGDRDRSREAFSKFEELRSKPQPSPFGLRRPGQ